MTARKKPDCVIEVLRDLDGKVFSQIRDRNQPPDRSIYLSRAVVIDRQRGRGMDQDTVLSRAQSLAGVTGLPFEEDLTWPCKADRGLPDCTCPRCVAKIEERKR